MRTKPIRDEKSTGEQEMDFVCFTQIEKNSAGIIFIYIKLTSFILFISLLLFRITAYPFREYFYT